MRYLFFIFLTFLPACNVCAARQIYVHARSNGRTADGSEASPFRTIAEALKVVKGGDTVVVREGVYRESVRVPGGQPGKPVSLKSADGERVILSGAVPVTGWKKCRDNVYVTELDFPPERLLVDCRTLPVARHPNEGWWTATHANDVTINDPKNLRTLDIDPAGGQAYIWTSHGNTFFTVPVARIDRLTGVLTLVRENKWMQIGAGDRYYLKNHPSLIDCPGEWAVQEEAGKFMVYLQPAAMADLSNVEASREARRVLLVHQANHVRISGLEVAAAAANGIEVLQSEDIAISHCIVHNHGGTGILVRDVNDVTIRRSILLYNTYGVMLHGAKNATVEENEIAYNDVDGLVVSWNSSDVTVRRNYIHHHLLWGHPDNIQLYRDVRNIRFIDNLLIGGGQSIMMAETSGGLLKGNMIVGCMAYSVIFGHRNAEDYRIHNNTIAFSGYGCMSLTARDYDVRENVLMSGHAGLVCEMRGVQGYAGHRNLLFNARGLAKKTVMASDKGWHSSFAHYQRATGYDLDSVYGDPRFRNAPIGFAVLDEKRLADCSRGTLYLRGGVGSIRLGDIIEVNFDGVPRKVIDRTREAITVSPPLEAKPITPSLVCRWGSNSSLLLDLRLATDSPGAQLSDSGGPVGSTIEIGAYQRGDFDADGKPDLPLIPHELEPERDKQQGVTEASKS